MPILDLDILRMQREGVLDGQLRIGTSSPGNKGGKKPVRLNTWRMTSRSRHAIEAAAERFGGKAKSWASDRGPQWEVITPLSELPVKFGGGAEIDQWMTHWEQGILLRHCTGALDAVNEISGKPCECNATGRKLCKPETKLRVRFLELPGIGWWRFTSHGKMIAAGFPARAEFLANAADKGIYVPARLVLLEMKLPPKRPGEPGRRFPIVDIDIDVSVEQIMRGEGVGTLREIVAGRQPLALAAAGAECAASAAPAVVGVQDISTSPPEGAAAATEKPSSQSADVGSGAAEPTPAELARQAYTWAMQPGRTRKQLVDFLGRHATSPAMEEYIDTRDGYLMSLKDLLEGRLEALTGAEETAP